MGRILDLGLTRRTKSENNDISNEVTMWVTGVGYIYHTHPKSTDNWSMIGYDISDFHKRKARGELLPHTHYYHEESKGSTTGGYDIYGPSGYRAYMVSGDRIHYQHWMVQNPDTWLEPYLSYASDVYAQAAAAKIYETGHDTLTFLAELASVRSMFINVGKRLFGALPYLTKGLYGKSSDWLSYRYGWRTLIYDLQDLNKAIIGLNSGRQRYSERTGSTMTSYDSGSLDEVVSTSTRHLVWGTKITCKLSGSVVADVEIPQFQFNPLRTGWEVIPFSFVVDWFLTIGKSLSAWSFLSLQEQYAASYGIHLTLERTFNQSATFKSGYSGTEWQTGSTTMITRKRVPCSVPIIPRNMLRLNPSKLIDLMSLIIQRKPRR